MKIQIIGLGVVGTAQAFLATKLGHEVVGYDVKSIKTHPYCQVIKTPIDDSDITFVCTHELNVEEVVRKIDNEIETNSGYNNLIVIRSTTPIGTIEKLNIKYDVHVSHNPEFLRENFSLEDIMNPNMIVIGKCCDYHGKILSQFYEPLHKPIYVVESNISELVKLTNNAYLSTLITFWNEIDSLSKTQWIDTHKISEILLNDKRISVYGTKFFGSPFEGKCLPKDMKHLINEFNSKQLHSFLFKACEEINNEIKK